MAAPQIAQAQTPQEAAAPVEATTPAATDPAASVEALRAALRDPQARAALLEELARALDDGGAAGAPASVPAAGNGAATAEAAGADPAAAEAGAEPPRTLGHRLAGLTRELGEAAVESGNGFVAGLAATQRRLGLLTDPQRGAALLAVGQSLLWLIVATTATHLVLHQAARRLYRRKAATLHAAPLLHRALPWAARLLADAATVLTAWGIGYAIAWSSLRETMTTGGASYPPAALYLNAFVVAQLGRVAIRALMAPETPALRLAPLSDQGARYWYGRLGGLLSILIYGLLFVTPLVAQTVSIFTGRAVAVVVYVLALLWAMSLVIRWRKAPSEYFAARAEAAGGDGTLRALAFVVRLWHWPALAYLVLLFVTAVSRSADVAPILLVTARAVAVLLAGAAFGALISRGAQRGVRLPEDVAMQVPLLEERLNGFLVRLLGAARLLLTVGAIGLAIQVSGLYDMDGWFRRRFGEDFAGVAFSVLAIVTVAFLLWLALASWVDWRLNPERQDPATARERTLLTLLRNAATIAIAVITLMITLSELGLDIAPLLASAGVLGLAIGFGAQRMVQDIITGIFIQFENAINVGDVVTVAGVTGTVEKLTIRSVSLRDVQGVFHIIPFSSVDMVSNFMRGFSFHVADIGVAYRENLDEAKRLMHMAFDDVKANPAFGRDILGPLDWFGVNALGDSAVVLRARIRTRPGAQWGVGRAYNEAVKKRFDAAGVEIPFPHMTVWFGEHKDGTAPPARMANPLTVPGVAAPVSAEAPAATPDAGRATASA
jgi:small conductance mechanosensitive channel